MRFFPRAARGRLLAALLAASLMGAINPVVDWARADELDDKHDEIKNEIAETLDDLEEVSAEAKAAATALAQAEADLGAAESRLTRAREDLAKARLFDRKMQIKLAESQSRLTAANISLALSKASVGLQITNIRGIITTQLQSGDPELVAFLAVLDSKTPEQLAINIGVQDAVVSKQTAVFEDLKKARASLKRQSVEVAQVTGEVAQAREAAAANVITMSQLELEAVALKSEIEELVVQRESARGEALKAKRQDERKLAELKAERARVEALLADRATDHQGPVDGSGALMYPVSGRVTSPFGYRRHPIYGYWGLHDGTDFAAPCGAPLYASASGTVLSSYWSSVYGYRLVLDHGVVREVNVASIYNHATNYVVSAGEKVQRGQVIGYVGSTGWSTCCHLHFTVMSNGVAVDPMGWF